MNTVKVDRSAGSPHPTVWGLSPTQLHDRFWAGRGVQVVRQGEPSQIVEAAELFLLTDARTLVIFKLLRSVDVLSWIKPDILYVRLHDEREVGYRERVRTDNQGRFVRFERQYGGSDARLARVVLTTEARIARLWQACQTPQQAWRAIRFEVDRENRSALSQHGRVFDRDSDDDVALFLRELPLRWLHPDSTISRPRQLRSGLWVDPDSQVDAAAAITGNVWIGAGRKLGPHDSVVGSRILWDDPAHRPAVSDVKWQEIEPAPDASRPVNPRRVASVSRAGKRLFDISFALLALLLTGWIYPIVMLAIWLEDGRPFFFAHRRETKGGREFPCIKFRSMRKDADRIKEELAAHNQADGPQFFMEEDPRLTAVGKFIRKTYIDELPQFINVLLGHMAVVGPRPSPRKENQFCPPWREARLSVRPGITGLWQVKRTRRKGLDFQEWIRYDLEYVENLSWHLDLKIIFETIRQVIRGVIKS